MNNIELLTKEDIRSILRQELPNILLPLLPKQDNKPVTGQEICEHFGICHVSLRKYRNQGKLPFIKIGKSYRYIKPEVREALTKNGVI